MLSILPARMVLVGSVLVAATFASSCASSQSDRLPGPARQVAVEGRAFTIAREPSHVCVYGPLTSLPTCLPLEFPLSKAVFGAVLEPLDTKADLLVVVTRPNVMLDGLPRGAVRAVIGSDEPGGARLAVWLALPAAGTPRVCATARGLPASQGFQVYRAVETPPGGAAEVAVDEC